MLKKYLTGFNKVIQIKEKKRAYETKCQILIVNEKSGWCKLNKDYVKKNITRENKKLETKPIRLTLTQKKFTYSDFSFKK